MIGTLKLKANVDHDFLCTFQGFNLAFLHVGDHLVCQYGAYSGTGIDNPLWPLSSDVLTFRLALVSNSTSSPRTASVQWALSPHSTSPSVDTLSSDNQDFNIAASAYFEWRNWNIDTVGHTMIKDGGDIASATIADCIAKCEELVDKGCVAFVRPDGAGDKGPCFMRRRSGQETCDSMLTDFKHTYSTYTRNKSCHFVPPYKPNPGPGPPGPPPPPQPIPSSAMSPDLPAGELERRAMQQQLGQGWGQFYHDNFLKWIHLPDSLALNFGLCQHSTGKCVTEATPDGRGKESPGCSGCVRVGNYAYDHSYAQFYIWWNGMNVSVELSAGPELSVLVAPISGNGSDFSFVSFASPVWARATTFEASADSVTFKPYGLTSLTVHKAVGMTSTTCDDFSLANCMAFPLTSAGAITTSAKKSVGDIASLIAKVRAAEDSTYIKYGALSETKVNFAMCHSCNLTVHSGSGSVWSYVEFDLHTS